MYGIHSIPSKPPPVKGAGNISRKCLAEAGQAPAKSWGRRAIRSSRLGASRAATRSAWRATASSKVLRAVRALPKWASRPAYRGLEPGGGGRLGLRGEGVAVLPAQPLEDGQQLGRGVIGKDQGLGEPAGQPRVAVEEVLHGLRVAGGDDHQVLPVVLHAFQGGPRWPPARSRWGWRGPGVGLVQKQHAPQGGLEDLLGLQGRSGPRSRPPARSGPLPQAAPWTVRRWPGTAGR